MPDPVTFLLVIVLLGSGALVGLMVVSVVGAFFRRPPCS
jgi:hypothetical protein